ncbi:MAG: flavodoxin family protein [Bacteroidaceae bacterium]|nr:flavodoxin family protein [Bacteroidaceae bacterium]
MQGCIACGWCGRNGRCTYNDQVYEQILNAVREGIDGYVIGSPVYYGGPNGSLCALMDRVCYSLGRYMQFRPAASVVVCRRGGASAAFDRLNKYFTILNMPVVSSQYWNMVYGQTPGQVAQDEEGMQTMRQLGRNMAWMIQRLDVNGSPLPEKEDPARTNFIR